MLRELRGLRVKTCLEQSDVKLGKFSVAILDKLRPDVRPLPRLAGVPAVRPVGARREAKRERPPAQGGCTSLRGGRGAGGGARSIQTGRDDEFAFGDHELLRIAEKADVHDAAGRRLVEPVTSRRGQWTRQ